MSICKYCGEEHPNKSMGIHSLNCKKNPKFKEYEENRNNSRDLKLKYICSYNVFCIKCNIEYVVIEDSRKFPSKEKYFCSRKCANSRVMTEKHRNNISIGVLKTTSKNIKIERIIDKISNTSKIIKTKKSKLCKNCNCEFTPLYNAKFCSSQCQSDFGVSQETRNKISVAVTGKTGGWRNFGGNGKKGTYKGLIYQSSWELAWLIYNFDHGNNPTRILFHIKYINENGKISKYYPDYELNDEYFEIKGFWSNKTELKLQAAKDQNIIINVLTKTEIKPYLEYSVSKYGKEFWNNAFLV